MTMWAARAVPVSPPPSFLRSWAEPTTASRRPSIGNERDSAEGIDWLDVEVGPRPRLVINNACECSRSVFARREANRSRAGCVGSLLGPANAGVL